MNSQRSPLRFSAPSRFLRPVAVALLALCGGVSVLAAADGMTQPDPPVPIERPAYKVALAQRDLDCRCAVMHARDMESRVDGHVERFEALSSAPPPQRASAATRARHVHAATYVEGMVGFQVRQFRLAADADDAAGSD
jgi:hypothetical protein